MSVKNSAFFISLLISHNILLNLFSASFYFSYFISLVCFTFLLCRHYEFSYKKVFLFSALMIGIINLNIYEEYVFELLLYTQTELSFYINSEVMYSLTLLHLIVLGNLKKFESFWTIIDEKLFRI